MVIFWLQDFYKADSSVVIISIVYVANIIVSGTDMGGAESVQDQLKCVVLSQIKYVEKLEIRYSYGSLSTVG